ncbi:MAG: rhodanese-like domain-containing protein [Lamprobacter sp.]|uniref:sulfurtransferase n=1 Tax=Lamprobacter sp. TaxID=3100796 RepID=UPI002B25CE2D|nr:rhodanese-like domain-containing protein [Lamprobacter sp.]MEA3640905.1 rhodanese-like domain-containing protein [Lamprobacter sp.]
MNRPLRYLLLALLVFLSAPTFASAPPLVDAQWLKANQDQSDLVVLDIQSAKDYQRFHIPGAVNAPYDRWRTQPPKPNGKAAAQSNAKTNAIANASELTSMLPPGAQLEAMLSELGVSNDDHVVIVATGRGASDLAAAARVFWTLKVLGHEQASLLDGGLVGYADTGAPLARGSEQRPATDYRAALQPELAPDAQAVRAALAAKTPLVDARSEGEFVGIYTGDDAERPGTIPGSHHLPHDWISDSGSGKLRSPGALKALFEARGVATDGEQIHFCHSGNRAALTWFAAYAVLGNEDALLYDGSMMEWARDDNLPISAEIELCDAC